MTSYQALAATDELAGAVAEIDTNGDGIGDVEIDLSTIDVLHA